MNIRNIKIYQLLMIFFLFTSVDQILAQYNIVINNKSNRTVAVLFDGILKNDLEPGDSKSYYFNDKLTINLSFSEKDTRVEGALLYYYLNGYDSEYDWKKYKIGSIYVNGSATFNLVPKQLSDGSNDGVDLIKVVPSQQQTSYSSYDYDDDDDLITLDDLFTWSVFILLVLGALSYLIGM